MNTFGKLLVKLGATPPPDSDYWYQPVNAPFGSYVSQFGGGSEALKVGVFRACVRLRSETIGSLPCQIYRREDTSRVLDRDHELYYLLHDAPNPQISAFEFWQVAEQALCTDGNFYARIETNGRGEVTGLYPLDETKMSVARDGETGLLVYTYRDHGGADTFVQGDILHVPGMGYDGVTRLKGMRPTEYMARSLELASSAESYGTNFFRNNAAPHAYIAHPMSLSPDAKQGILDYMMKHWGGVKNSGKLGILEEGMKIETVPTDHGKMQYLELRRFQIEEIARGMGVPLHMIGELMRSTNNNIEHQGIEWVTNTVRPEVTRIERRCNMQLLGPRESSRWFIEFNLDALLRGDSAARAAMYQARFNTASISPNEIRAKENDNGYEGGDGYFLNGTMIPVTMAGQQYGAKAEAAQ